MIVKISFVIFEFNTSIALIAISSGVILDSPFGGITPAINGARNERPATAGSELMRLVIFHWLRSTLQSRSEEHTSELQSRPHLVCRLLLEKKKNNNNY